MTLEGELLISLAWDGARVRDVKVTSTRPLVASRILTGKTAVDAASMVPLLYSICGGAQGAAAACAMAAAGAAGFEADVPGRHVGIVVEALQEGFWHLLIGWPNAMGSDPQVTPVTAARYLIATSTRKSDGSDLLGDADAMRALAARLSDLAAKALFGIDAKSWLALADVAALRDWAAKGTTTPARLFAHVLAGARAAPNPQSLLMPAPRRDLLLRVVAPDLLADPEFAHAPTWSGQPVESSALSRMCEHPLVAAVDRMYGHVALTRAVARMAEIAELLGELAGTRPSRDPARAQSIPLGPGDGLGAVQTARGLLLHRVRLREECVVEYQIVAPTEWNFHPDGALVKSLTDVAATGEPEALRLARFAAHTLDPCVACRVEIAHA